MIEKPSLSAGGSTPPDPPESPLSGAARRALGWWVGHVYRLAWVVIGVILLVTVLLGVYTATHLGMQTDTSAMLSARLDWRRDSDRHDAAFPRLVRNIVIVVDAPNPDTARDGAAALARRLAARGDIFEAVYDPAGDPFFRKHGLLFLDVEALDRLSTRLADAQPLLSRLARDPSLRGFFDTLSTAAREVAKGEGDSAALAPIFARVADTVADTMADTMADTGGDVRSGRLHGLSWVELIEGKSLSPGERWRIILAKPKPDYGALSPAKQAIALIRELASDPEIGGVSIRLTGTLPLQHEEMASVQRSAGLAGVISLVLVGVVIFAGLRSGRLVFATLTILVVGLVWTAAFAAAVIGYLNIISVAFAVLFLGISVDFGIQICLRYREAVEEGMRNELALRASCAGVGPAIGLSALTSAIGFFAFVPTDYVGMAELGIIAGSGIFIALFLYLTLLPAMLAITPLARQSGVRQSGAPRGGEVSPAGGLALMEGWLARHRKTVALGCLAAALAALAALPHLRFEFDPIKLKDPRAESVRTYLDLARYTETSPYSVDVLATDAAAAEGLAARLKTLPEVARVVTLGSFVPGRQPEKLEIIDGMNLFLAPIHDGAAKHAPPGPGDRKAALLRLRDRLRDLAASPKAGAAAAPAKRLAGLLDRYAGAPAEVDFQPLETALLGTLPGRLAELKDSLSAGRVTPGALPENLRNRWIGRGGEARVTVYPAADLTDPAALRQFVNAIHGIAPNATETPVLILRAGDAVVTAFLRAGAIATLCIVVALLVILRNLADALLVLAPVLVAALLTLAATVVLDIPFNFANVIALPLLLALGVDFGIHLVLRRREAGSVEALLRTSTPRAVLYSGLTTMCSFGSLAVSGHLGTASMGYLLLISLTFGLLSALVALPALLSWRESRATREEMM